MENSPRSFPQPSRCSHCSLGLTLSLTLLSSSDIGTFSLFLLLNHLAIDIAIAHICWLTSSVEPAFLGISGLPLAPSGLRALSLYVESFSGKSKPSLCRDSREYTLRFCWRRVRFFCSFTSRGRTTQRVKIWPADTPRFPCATKHTYMFSHNKWLYTRIERCAIMLALW